MTSLIKANNVSLTGGKERILDNICLALEKGDFLTLIGPNGAGKTMLLKVLLGLVAPDEGSVETPPALKIGYMPQSVELHATLPLRVKDFLGLKKNRSQEGLDEVIAQTEIEPTLDTMLYELSSGQRQKALLAYALLDHPDLLVLDEPAQNLDMSSQLALYALLDKIYAHGDKTILMVSHDLHFVMSSTKQVVCLFHHVCCSGAPQQIAADPAFVSLFGKAGQDILSAYAHQHDHAH